MLYYHFPDFEGFKELFGIQHHGNGEKSRKNKILLSFIKTRQLLHEAIVSGDYELLHISNMVELKQKVTRRIRQSAYEDDSLRYGLEIKNDLYRNSSYYTDESKGLCEDGDYKSFRYVNAENDRVFKMKTGKLYRKLILDTPFGKTLPEQVITYLCEEMAQEWQSYAMSHLPKNSLHVNKNFQRIYDSDYLDGDFGSCMVDKGFHSFYEDAVDASAAYLENEKGDIIARCVIFNKAIDQYGETWRLAERQYSTNSNDVLKRALIDALIAGNHIDGYKTVGAGCSDTQSFVDLKGNSLSDRDFYIECDLDWDDTVSYQDSFKNYDMDRRRATNYGIGELQLDGTEGDIEGDSDYDEDREYDDYHSYYCDSITTVYRNGHELYCDSGNLEDFRWVESLNEYHHYEDVHTCARCDEYYLEDSNHYSEITEEDYCCESCREDAEDDYKSSNWTYSEYDEEYYEEEDDVTTYKEWMNQLKTYVESTISQETLDQLIEEGDFHYINGIAYDFIDVETGLPYGEESHTAKEAA